MKHIMHLAPLALLTSLPLFAAGCESTTCGPGSVQQGDQCVPSQLTPTCGAGTELQDGVCVAVEPDGTFGYCGGRFTDTVIDADGNCKPAGGKAGSNAALVTGLELVDPAGLAADANGSIATSLQGGLSRSYVGVFQVGTSPYRVWGGTDADVADERSSLTPGSSFDAAATTAGEGVDKRLTSEKTNMSLQLLGSDTIIEDAEIVEGELDETGSFPTLTRFRLRGTLTPANAAKVDLASTPLDQVIEDAPTIDADGNGSDESWAFEAIITAMPEIVSER